MKNINDLFPGNPVKIIPEANINLQNTAPKNQLGNYVLQLTLLTGIIILAAYLLNESKKEVQCD
jgi:hypothetical protein